MQQNNLKDKMHLVPEIIINLIDKYKTSKVINEKMSLELRLEAIRDMINETLEKSLFNKR